MPVELYALCGNHKIFYKCSNRVIEYYVPKVFLVPNMHSIIWFLQSLRWMLFWTPFYNWGNGGERRWCHLYRVTSKGSYSLKMVKSGFKPHHSSWKPILSEQAVWFGANSYLTISGSYIVLYNGTEEVCPVHQRLSCKVTWMWILTLLSLPLPPLLPVSFPIHFQASV